MATMPTPNQLLAAAKATGFPVVEMAGWRGRFRCHDGSHEGRVKPTGRAFGPWHGITIHQTAGPRLTGAKAEQYNRNILIGGNGHVPGPLCQYGVGGDGTIYMIAAGRSNHIGRISQAGLDAMRAGSFSLDGYHNLRGSGVDGNRYTIGFELLMNGATLRDTPTDRQRMAAVALAAELARINGWSGRETHGHGEVSIDRTVSDPGYNMGRFRRDIMTRVASGTGAAAASATAKDWFDMASIEELRQVVEAALRTGKLGKDEWGGYWGSSFANNIGHIGVNTHRLLAEVAGLSRAIEALASSQGADPAVIREAARAGVADALGALEAEVKLTIEKEES